MQKEGYAEEMAETKHKAVSLVELFFDLVFVYAIAKLTGFLEVVAQDGITAPLVFQYVFDALIILQVWLYQTNYNNRFGGGRWHENAAMLFNMMIVLFVSNTIGVGWSEISGVFDLSMILMLGSIACLCCIEWRSGRGRSREAGAYFKMLVVLVATYAMSALLYVSLDTSIPSQAVTVGAGIIGSFLPALVWRKGAFGPEATDFPHLTERFELLVIITLGEAVTAVAGLFELGTLGPLSFAAFAVLALLFGCYVMHNHYLVDRHAEGHGGALLMASHYVIVIAINMLTFGLLMVIEGGAHGSLVHVWTAAGSLLFFGGLFMNGAYYGQKTWGAGQKVLLVAICFSGACISAVSGTTAGCMSGLAITAGLIFAILFWKAYELGCFRGFE